MQEAISFLRSIWKLQAGSTTPYFCVSTKSSKSSHWKDHFLKWPIRQDAFEQFFDKYPTDDYNLYFCPHGFTKPERKKEYATPTIFLWADLDAVLPEHCKPVPQVAWSSSPNRYAALWKLTRAHDASVVEETNRNLAYAAGADKSGWDLTQVLRIPFTRNHKYKSSPFGKMLWAKLSNALSLGSFPDGPPLGSDAKGDPSAILEKYRDKIKKDTMRLLTAPKANVGGRSDMIWKLENDLAEQGLPDDAIFILIKHSVWNKFAGRRSEDEQLKRELEKVRSKSVRPTIARKEKPLSVDEDGEERQRYSGLVRMADVEPEKVEFLWYPYLPRGKLTMLEGDPGLGKSWFTMALASFFSRGKRLPGADKGVKGNVLLMSAEDGIGDTIRPRLDTLSADNRHVFTIAETVTFDEEGIEEVEKYIDECRPLLLIVDPFVAYIGAGVDLHKANETREVMDRLTRLAEKYGMAVLLVRHLTKGGRDKSIYRGIGSIDLTAAVRSVLMIGRHPEAPDESRVFVHIKSNLAPTGKAQSYSLRAKALRPFTFDGPVEFTAEEVFKAEQTGASKGDWEITIEFVKESLTGGPRLADEVRRDGEARGISTKMINKAKRELKLRVTTNGDTVTWQLPRI